MSATTPHDDVWRALSDPTRRSLLDLLGPGPRTTGDLCERFEATLSRFAVMKHLDVLERAGLVLVRYEGKHRWNHVNAVPLKAALDAWLRPRQQAWAEGLIDLKDRIERKAETMAKTATKERLPDMTCERVELEIPIDAPRDRVWKTLCEDPTSWWPRDFYATGAKRFVIEPRLGGSFYEDAGDGAGLVWYTVMGIDPKKSMTLSGFIVPDFGGPATSLLELKLEGSGKKTVLKVSDAHFGKRNEECDREEGWRTIFEAGLKRVVEAA